LRGGPFTSIGKVHQGDLNQRVQLAACDLRGVGATAWEGDRMPAEVKGMLRSRANTIEGGTTEVNKNVIGERVLGLPREPDAYDGKPWKDVPRS
jgi:alkylation response protein AidB-like acyl-CoA dehydrogenase